MTDEQVYVANTTFSTDLDGAAVVVHKDRDRVSGNHPLYLQCPALFDPVSDHVRFGVETAVAVPGEDRGSSPLPASLPPAPAPAPSPAADSTSKSGQKSGPKSAAKTR